MKNHSALLAAALLVFAVVACNYSASVGYKTSEIHMAKDDNGMPGAETSTFNASEHTIHCVTKLNEAKDGTKVNFAWWSVDTAAAKNEKLKDLDYTTKGEENIVHAHLTAPQDWPKGKWKCTVTIDGKPDRSVDYTIE